MIKTYTYSGKNFYLIQLSYTDKKGKRHQPKYRLDLSGHRITSKRKAERLEVEYRMELKAKVECKYSILSFAEFYEVYLKQIRLTHKKGTVLNYDGGLRKWLTTDFTNKKLNDITKSDIHKFIFESLPKKNASVHTQKRILKILRIILQVALEEEYIARNPANGIRVKTPPAIKQVFNTKEAVHFLEQAKESQHPFYFHWAMALLTGMRNGELYALRWSDIDEIAGNITISASWSNKDGYHSTKSNKTRIFPISSELKKLLIELKNRGPFSENLTALNGNNRFFENLVLPRIREWKNGEQSRVTRDFCKLIRLKEIKFHDLRATFITNLLSQGASLPQVMSIVGHSKMSTTDEYLRLAGVNIKGSTDKLGYSLPNVTTSQILSFSNS